MDRSNILRGSTIVCDIKIFTFEDVKANEYWTQVYSDYGTIRGYGVTEALAIKDCLNQVKILIWKTCCESH